MFLTSKPVTAVGEMITVVLFVRNVCFFSVVYKQDSVDDVISDNFKSGLMQEQFYDYGVVKNKGYFYSKHSLRGFILIIKAFCYLSGGMVCIRWFPQ